MKTILMVFAFSFTMAFAGNASTVSSTAKSQTENLAVSKTNASSHMKAVKSNKAHKHHKKAAGTKSKK